MVLNSNGQNLLELSLWNTKKPVLNAIAQEHIIHPFFASVKNVIN